MLALATQLAGIPYTDDFAFTAEARSKICGSAITLGLNLDNTNCVSHIGMKLSACAVGQSSAAILAGAIKGKQAEEIAFTRDAIHTWLNEQGDLPDWPRFAVLAGAKEHRGRHGALMLPWDACLNALSSAL